MNRADLIALSPLLAMALAPIAVMLSIAARRRHTTCVGLSFLSILVALFCVSRAFTVVPRQVGPLIVIDAFGLFYATLILGITGIVLILGLAYVAHRESHPEEYYVLLLLAAAGACVMPFTTHFASFFLGLEVMSISQYGLVAYIRKDRRGTEAAVKYLVLSSASAAFLLFGMALIYAEMGTMRMDALAHVSPDQLENKVLLLGAAMMLASVGFKLSIVPFHLWTPDVYEGAPIPVTAFAATVSKIAMLAVFVRYFTIENAPMTQALSGVVTVAAAASMIGGNILALLQDNVKRLLAYSSIAHMGYLAIAFLSGGDVTSDGVGFYLVAYCAATLGAFGAMMTLSAGMRHDQDAERFDDYRGLYWTHPTIAVVLAISLLSLAGIPLTAGFIGKFYIVLSGAQSGHWALLVILALSSVIGVYYYLRLLVGLFVKPGTETGPVQPLGLRPKVVLLLLAAMTLIMGVYPAPIIAFIHSFGT